MKIIDTNDLGNWQLNSALFSQTQGFSLKQQEKLKLIIQQIRLNLNINSALQTEPFYCSVVQELQLKIPQLFEPNNQLILEQKLTIRLESYFKSNCVLETSKQNLDKIYFSTTVDLLEENKILGVLDWKGLNEMSQPSFSSTLACWVTLEKLQYLENLNLIVIGLDNRTLTVSMFEFDRFQHQKISQDIISLIEQYLHCPNSIETISRESIKTSLTELETIEEISI